MHDTAVLIGPAIARGRSVITPAAALLLVLALAPIANASKPSSMRLDGSRAFAKAHRLVHEAQRLAFANSYTIPDCDRLSTRRITCRYRLDFVGRIAPCDDRITLTTRRFLDGARYIGWKIGKDALECSAGLDVPVIEITPSPLAPAPG